MNKNKNSPSKFRWSMLAPENIQFGKPYSFTLNLKDECDNIKDEYNHYLYIISLFIKPHTEFQLYFELSCIGKLHIHGTIYFYDYENIARFYYKFGKLKHRFSCELDTIEDITIWDKYCCKQQQIIGSILPLNGELCNKDMVEKQYLSPKVREQVEDNVFEETHLDIEAAKI